MPTAPNAIALPGATPLTTTDPLFSVRAGTRVTNTLSAPGVEPPPPTVAEPLPDLPEVPGSLGRRGVTGPTQQLLAQAHRVGANAVLLFPRNHRYRGHREAAKFNAVLQHALAVCAQGFLTLRVKDEQLKTAEAAAMPTPSEIALIYHTQAQLRFHEWSKLRDVNTSWFE